MPTVDGLTIQESTEDMASHESQQRPLRTSQLDQPPALAAEHQTWLDEGQAGHYTGRLVDDVVVGQQIGEGGMGTVYRAWQISVGRRVAVKVMLRHLARSEEIRDRFELEFTTVSRLQSPHIVQVYGAGLIARSMYFSMEFVGNGDVQGLINQHKEQGSTMSATEAADMVRQAALGLAEAGRQGVVHRDIKPSNLMLNDQGVVKIADFGIAKLIGEHGVTVTGTAMGTPTYCSPEQGRGGRVDHRSDIYSLGVVLYELLCGRPPFEGASGSAIIYQHNYAEPELPIKIRPDLDPRFQAIVLTCLQKEPTQRYQKSDHLATDLAAVVGGEAPLSVVTSGGTGASQMMRRQGLRRRNPWISLSLAVVVIGLSVTVWQLQVNGNGDTPPVPRDVLLRGQLAFFDQAVPLPVNVRDRLQEFAALVGNDDIDVIRWREKLQELETLEVSWQLVLEELGDNPSARVEAQQLLRRWRVLLGPDDQQIIARGELLEDLVQRELSLRSELAVIDRFEQLLPVDVARWDDFWSQLEKLVLPNDPDLRRWRDRLDAAQAYHQFLIRQAESLSVEQQLNESELQSRRQEVQALASLYGDQDPVVVEARQVLSQLDTRWRALVANLSRLDGAQPYASQQLQTELASDLKLYQRIVPLNDRNLQRWQEHVERSSQQITDLREQLQRLDQDQLLTNEEISRYRSLLISYRRLVGQDDAALLTWRHRIRHESSLVDQWQQQIDRLRDETPLTMAEWESLSTAMESGRSLLDEEERNRWLQRLQREGNNLSRLQQAIAGPIPLWTEPAAQVARDAIARLEPSPQRDAWQQRLQTMAMLRRELSSLDQPGPLNQAMLQAWQQYLALVPLDDPYRQRWQQRIERQLALFDQISILDQQQAITDDMTPLLDDYQSLAGAADPHFLRWQQRWQDIQDIRQLLSEALRADAVTISSTVVEAVRQLAGYLGEQAAEVVAAQAHVTRLLGPADAPEWAIESGRDQFGLWAELAFGGQRQRFRYVPPAVTELGSPADEAGRDPDEQAVWMRLSDGFWLADTECSQALWRAVVERAIQRGVIGDDDLDESPSRFSQPQNPVEQVSYLEVQQWLGVLNAMVPGLRTRLPSELEWELAAGGGYQGPHIGEGGELAISELDRVAWFRAVCDRPQVIAQRNSNPLGLYDYLGNVWEWCLDAYAPYPVLPAEDRIGRGSNLRVVRGGSFADEPLICRIANRHGLDQDRATMMVGFRILIPLAQSHAATSMASSHQTDPSRRIDNPGFQLVT